MMRKVIQVIVGTALVVTGVTLAFYVPEALVAAVVIAVSGGALIGLPSDIG
jgi:hypothetical protein